MAWYPGAKKMELQPESDQQQAIRPTQLIVHSIVANWTARRTYEFWRDSTNLESHFGIGYGAGDIAQYIGTETRADANAGANRRPDGSGAISVETASNSTATDPWNASQLEELIELGVWAHRHHGIPLRICRTSGDPGFGYHSMFAAWSTSGTACPGPARIRQFREVVFPGIVARATGKTTPPKKDEDTMTPAQEALLKKVAADLGSVKKDVAELKKNAALAPWTYKNAALVAEAKKSGGKVPDMHGRVQHIEQMLEALTKEN
ncbi:N-acetylmuramoyl-L-alanine amidase [Streptomyces sp. ADI98-10]|uniref:peptidoglycan recognition protein family protein n=1 Tax=Streptomyces sp. ADI98-10 TaxID=1522763 RepID=UPI000F54D991|nr:N-acetylmuramoyl-L-alanine amidase [Streptomyces sp. ADI98-10]RPK85052.1 N-acetylmuramoyl-L-alanine amidase [Streptomyces sp. ADI98-10]